VRLEVTREALPPHPLRHFRFKDLLESHDRLGESGQNSMGNELKTLHKINGCNETSCCCERCLLITESPKTPGHYRYLIWVLVYIPYTGLAVFSYAIFSCSCVYCDFEFLKYVFSTIQSRSCWQLTNSCLLRGLEGLLLWIDILSFLLPIWYIFEVFVGCQVRLICSRSLFLPVL